MRESLWGVITATVLEVQAGSSPGVRPYPGSAKMSHTQGRGSGRWAGGPCGQHRFDDVDCQDTGQRPRSREQFGACPGVFDGTTHTLHRWIIGAYDLGEVEYRA